MDERLRKHQGERVEALTEEKLPRLAQWIVAVVRGRAKVSVSKVGTKDVVVFSDGGPTVLADDWVKLKSAIEGGEFIPLVFPDPHVAVLDPVTRFDLPAIPVQDRPLYERVLHRLQEEFPRKFPRP